MIHFITYPCVLSARLKAFIPYLVGFAGMYCFEAKCPRNPTMVSSTARLCPGENAHWKFGMRRSSISLTLLIFLAGLLGSSLLTCSIQKIYSKRFCWKTHTKIGMLPIQLELGLDRLCSRLCLLFFFFMLKDLAYYASQSTYYASQLQTGCLLCIYAFKNVTKN